MDNKEFEMLQPYCENGMKKLKQMSRAIFLKLNEPLSGADYDDFYSLANMTLWQAYNSYDPEKGVCFEAFLYTCIQKKFKTEVESRHRGKRVLNQLATSLDAVGNNGDEYSLLDLVPSDFDTFDEMMGMQDRKESYQDKAQEYISRLSGRQIAILNLLIDGYEPVEIRQQLKISPKEYASNLKIMRSYENVKVLF